MEIKKKVQNILANVEETRNSDNILLVEYMKQYLWIYLSDNDVRKFLEWPSISTIIRVRCEIQNEDGILRPDSETQTARRNQFEKYRLRYSKKEIPTTQENSRLKAEKAKENREKLLQIKEKLLNK